MEDRKPAESFGEWRDEKQANPFPELLNRDEQGLVDLIVRMELLQDLWRCGHNHHC
jgi:hypothetical protein